MNLIKKLAGQTAVYGLSTIIGRFLNYLLVPLHTYLFIPEKFGVVAELYAYVGFLFIILTYGMETSFFRHVETEKDKNSVFSTAFLSLVATSTLFILILWILSGSIASMINYPDNPEYVIWFGLVIGFDAIAAIPFASLRQQGRSKLFAAIKLTNIGINILLNLGFLLLLPWIDKNFGTSLYNDSIGVGYIFIANLVASIATAILLLPFVKTKFKFDAKLLKKMLIYGIPLLVAGLAGMINETLDRILLRNFLPDGINVLEQIGLYGANFKIAVLMTLFIQMFRYAAEPFFFAQAKEKNSKQLYADVMKYFVIFGLVIFLGVNLYLDIIKYFIAESFHSGLKIVPIVLMANLFLGIVYNLSIWYKLNNLTKYGAYIAIFGAIITIIVNIIFIPYIGYLGSAYAHLLCYLSMVLISYFIGRRIFPIPYDLLNIGIYILIALGLFFISNYFRPDSQTFVYLLNTILFLAFVIFVVKREKLHKIFLSK